jgi:cytochrome c-type biogenesis protein CcmH
MSPRDSFWFLAGALVAFAIMVTVRAWLRERPALAERPAGGPGIPSFAVPIAAALALIGVALGIYFLLGSPDSIASSHAVASAEPGQQAQMGQPSTTAGSLDDVTNKLAARLATKGGSDNDWKLLAESYEYMGRTAEAAAAKAHIASATPAAAGDSTGEVPAVVTGDQVADIADAFDKPTATTWAAGAEPVASGSPPAASAPGATTTSAARGAAGNPREAASQVRATASGNAEISGTVEITSKLAHQAATGATLFIYAKQPNTPGPPLAVLRVRAEHWPVTFTLNDGNAMVPGRNLSNAANVQIEARISKNGDALPQSGDLVGSVTSVNPRDGHPVKISIDREIG